MKAHTESRQALQAWGLYRDMGPDRSLAAVGQELGKSRALIERWSTRYGWVQRAAEHDRKIQEEAARRDLEKRVKEQERRRDRSLRVSDAMVEMVLDLLVDPEKQQPRSIRELARDDVRSAIDLFKIGRAAERLDLPGPAADAPTAASPPAVTVLTVEAAASLFRFFADDLTLQEYESRRRLPPDAEPAMPGEHPMLDQEPENVLTPDFFAERSSV